MSDERLNEKHREAAHELGELFCWSVDHLGRFPPLKGNWIDEIKRRLLQTESPPPIIGILGRLIAAGYSLEYHADQDGPYELWPESIGGQRIAVGETFEQLCVNILMNESLNEVLE